MHGPPTYGAIGTVEYTRTYDIDLISAEKVGNP
jgi:hypothetical protein